MKFAFFFFFLLTYEIYLYLLRILTHTACTSYVFWLTQVQSIAQADVIVAKYQLQKALNFAVFNIYKRCFREMKVACAGNSIIRKFAMQKFVKMVSWFINYSW